MKNNQITQKRLKEVLNYSKATGIFRWAINKGQKTKYGDVAGWADSGYTRIQIDGKSYRAHRLAWLYVYGGFPTNKIDHINQIKSDNRIANLRDVTHTENLQNQKLYKTNTSGVVGVHWHKVWKRWEASITVDGIQKYLGKFKDKSKAIKARKDATIKYGFHKNHGGVLC